MRKIRIIARCLKTMAGRGKTGFVVALLMVGVVFVHSAVNAAPVAVRFQEGKTHGFLLVRSLDGDIIGQGEITQVAQKRDLVESQLVFRFKDGSLYDEKVAFSQDGVFTLITYHLVQRGPFFPEQVDVFFDRGAGTYKVQSRTGGDETEDVRTGTVDLPPDVYNGMVITMLLNLSQGVAETVRFLVFGPEPEVVKLQLQPRGERTIRIGDWSRPTIHYEFKPDIGLIRRWLGRLTGNLPDEFHYHCWILADDLPSFVRYEGPLQLMGPIVRIDLVSPGLPDPREENQLTSR